MKKGYLKKESSSAKNWWAIGFLLFMVVGMSSSFIFFGFNEGSATERFEGLKFTYVGDHWAAKINGKMAAFSYPPSEALKVKIQGDLPPQLLGKLQIDTTSFQNDTLKEAIGLAQYQMGLTMYTYGVYVRAGFDANNSLGMPIISCDAPSSPSFVPIVQFKHSNSTQISVNGNCIIAEAQSGAEALLVKDRILYSALGVLK